MEWCSGRCRKYPYPVRRAQTCCDPEVFSHDRESLYQAAPLQVPNRNENIRELTIMESAVISKGCL